jgi:hypothetical protein
LGFGSEVEDEVVLWELRVWGAASMGVVEDGAGAMAGGDGVLSVREVARIAGTGGGGVTGIRDWRRPGDSGRILVVVRCVGAQGPGGDA